MAIATSAKEIEVIYAAGRTAILLGFQNSNLLEGRVRFVELFSEHGVRPSSSPTTIRTSWAAAATRKRIPGCRAPARRSCARSIAGILVDLSHVGNRTTKDAIMHSEKPVAVTHANPDSLFPHKRNKTDDVLKVLAEKGGVLGCATYRNITGDYYCSSLGNSCEMVARRVDIMGIDHVGIGTDRSHNFTKPDYDWMRMGRWTRGIDYGAASAARPGKAPPPAWFQEVHHLGLLPGGLKEVGFSAEEVEKITSGNWLRLYRAVFAAADQVKEARLEFVQSDSVLATTPRAAASSVRAPQERIALDIHAHLAPVLKDRIARVAGVSWNEAEAR